MSSAPEILVFAAMVIVVAVVGIRLGMLAAPRLDRLTQRSDEDDRGDDD